MIVRRFYRAKILSGRHGQWKGGKANETNGANGASCCELAAERARGGREALRHEIYGAYVIYESYVADGRLRQRALTVVSGVEDGVEDVGEAEAAGEKLTLDDGRPAGDVVVGDAHAGAEVDVDVGCLCD